MALCQVEETVLTGNQEMALNSDFYCHLVVSWVSYIFESVSPYMSSPPLLSAGR